MSDLLKPRILAGHVLDQLRALPDGSVQCVVTSPPFWGLRLYSVCGCAQGYVRSPTPSVDGGAVRRKAADPNCRWCGGTGRIDGQEAAWGGDVLGCSHKWAATSPRRTRGENDTNSAVQQGNRGTAYNAEGGILCAKCGCWFGSLGLEPTPQLYVEHMVAVFREIRRVLRSDGVAWCEIGDSYAAGSNPPGGLKPKDLVMIPFRLALALQADGWWVRSDDIWARQNPMPESVRDRPARAHSYVFQLTKGERYFYDADAVREVATGGHPWGKAAGGEGNKVAGNDTNIRQKESWYDSMRYQFESGDLRNLRTVWNIPSAAGYDAGIGVAHFASFPERLPEICILASTSEKGACPECGAPWRRVVAVDYEVLRDGLMKDQPKHAAKAEMGISSERGFEVAVARRQPTTVGWAPTCKCYPDPCDLCEVAWTRRKVERRSSTFNVRVRDAKSGALGFKSGLAGEKADATEDEIDAYDGGTSGPSSQYRYQEAEVSWPGCDCRKPVPCTVLDPFAGSGTTLAVAKRLGRQSVGVELNPAYCAVIEQRVSETRTETARDPAQRRLTAYAEE